MKQPKIIKREEPKNAIDTGASYLIEWPCGISLWFNVWHDNGETTGDWNKYIFHTNDDDDMKEIDRVWKRLEPHLIWHKG